MACADLGLATVRFLTDRGFYGDRECSARPGSCRRAPIWRTITGAAATSSARSTSDPGRLGRVVSGTGLALREHAVHPDTGIALAGFQHPHWAAMSGLALEGARLMRHVPLIGWDVACTTLGPVIVEMNEAPDFFLVQLADRKGVLGPEFDAFLAEQRRRAVDHRRTMKRTIAKL